MLDYKNSSELGCLALGPAMVRTALRDNDQYKAPGYGGKAGSRRTG